MRVESQANRRRAPCNVRQQRAVGTLVGNKPRRAASLGWCPTRHVSVQPWPLLSTVKRSGHSTPPLDRAERTRSPRAAPGGGCLRREGRQTSAQLAHPATRSLDPRASRSCCLSSGDWPGPPAKRTPTIVTLQRDLQLEREKHRRTQESVEQLRMEMQMMARLLAASREQLVSLGAETLSPDMSVLMPQAVRRHPVSRTASPQPAP